MANGITKDSWEVKNDLALLDSTWAALDWDRAVNDKGEWSPELRSALSLKGEFTEKHPAASDRYHDHWMGTYFPKLEATRGQAKKALKKVRKEATPSKAGEFGADVLGVADALFGEWNKVAYMGIPYMDPHHKKYLGRHVGEALGVDMGQRTQAITRGAREELLGRQSPMGSVARVAQTTGTVLGYAGLPTKVGAKFLQAGAKATGAVAKKVLPQAAQAGLRRSITAVTNPVATSGMGKVLAPLGRIAGGAAGTGAELGVAEALSYRGEESAGDYFRDMPEKFAGGFKTGAVLGAGRTIAQGTMRAGLAGKLGERVQRGMARHPKATEKLLEAATPATYFGVEAYLEDEIYNPQTGKMEKKSQAQRWLAGLEAGVAMGLVSPIVSGKIGVARGVLERVSKTKGKAAQDAKKVKDILDTIDAELQASVKEVDKVQRRIEKLTKGTVVGKALKSGLENKQVRNLETYRDALIKKVGVLTESANQQAELIESGLQRAFTGQTEAEARQAAQDLPIRKMAEASVKLDEELTRTRIEREEDLPAFEARTEEFKQDYESTRSQLERLQTWLKQGFTGNPEDARLKNPTAPIYDIKTGERYIALDVLFPRGESDVKGGKISRPPTLVVEDANGKRKHVKLEDVDLGDYGEITQADVLPTFPEGRPQIEYPAPSKRAQRRERREGAAERKAAQKREAAEREAAKREGRPYEPEREREPDEPFTGEYPERGPWTEQLPAPAKGAEERPDIPTMGEAGAIVGHRGTESAGRTAKYEYRVEKIRDRYVAQRMEIGKDPRERGNWKEVGLRTDNIENARRDVASVIDAEGQLRDWTGAPKRYRRTRREEFKPDLPELEVTVLEPKGGYQKLPHKQPVEKGWEPWHKVQDAGTRMTREEAIEEAKRRHQWPFRYSLWKVGRKKGVDLYDLLRSQRTDTTEEGFPQQREILTRPVTQRLEGRGEKRGPKPPPEEPTAPPREPRPTEPVVPEGERLGATKGGVNVGREVERLRMEGGNPERISALRKIHREVQKLRRGAELTRVKEIADRVIAEAPGDKSPAQSAANWYLSEYKRLGVSRKSRTEGEARGLEEVGRFVSEEEGPRGRKEVWDLTIGPETHRVELVETGDNIAVRIAEDTPEAREWFERGQSIIESLVRGDVRYTGKTVGKEVAKEAKPEVEEEPRFPQRGTEIPQTEGTNKAYEEGASAGIEDAAKGKNDPLTANPYSPHLTPSGKASAKDFDEGRAFTNPEWHAFVRGYEAGREKAAEKLAEKGKVEEEINQIFAEGRLRDEAARRLRDEAEKAPKRAESEEGAWEPRSVEWAEKTRKDLIKRLQEELSIIKKLPAQEALDRRPIVNYAPRTAGRIKKTTKSSLERGIKERIADLRRTDPEEMARTGKTAEGWYDIRMEGEAPKVEKKAPEVEKKGGREPTEEEVREARYEAGGMEAENRFDKWNEDYLSSHAWHKADEARGTTEFVPSVTTEAEAFKLFQEWFERGFREADVTTRGEKFPSEYLRVAAAQGLKFGREVRKGEHGEFYDKPELQDWQDAQRPDTEESRAQDAWKEEARQKEERVEEEVDVAVERAMKEESWIEYKTPADRTLEKERRIEAYREGLDAALRGEALEDNPYGHHTDPSGKPASKAAAGRHAAWESAFSKEEARQKEERVEEEQAPETEAAPKAAEAAEKVAAREAKAERYRIAEEGKEEAFDKWHDKFEAKGGLVERDLNMSDLAREFDDWFETGFEAGKGSTRGTRFAGPSLRSAAAAGMRYGVAASKAKLGATKKAPEEAKEFDIAPRPKGTTKDDGEGTSSIHAARAELLERGKREDKNHFLDMKAESELVEYLKSIGVRTKEEMDDWISEQNYDQFHSEPVDKWRMAYDFGAEQGFQRETGQKSPKELKEAFDQARAEPKEEDNFYGLGLLTDIAEKGSGYLQEAYKRGEIYGKEVAKGEHGEIWGEVPEAVTLAQGKARDRHYKVPLGEGGNTAEGSFYQVDISGKGPEITRKYLEAVREATAVKGPEPRKGQAGAIFGGSPLLWPFMGRGDRAGVYTPVDLLWKKIKGTLNRNQQRVMPKLYGGKKKAALAEITGWGSPEVVELGLRAFRGEARQDVYNRLREERGMPERNITILNEVLDGAGLKDLIARYDPNMSESQMKSVVRELMADAFVAASKVQADPAFPLLSVDRNLGQRFREVMLGVAKPDADYYLDALAKMKEHGDASWFSRWLGELDKNTSTEFSALAFDSMTALNKSQDAYRGRAVAVAKSLDKLSKGAEKTDVADIHGKRDIPDVWLWAWDILDGLSRFNKGTPKSQAAVDAYTTEKAAILVQRHGKEAEQQFRNTLKDARGMYEGVRKLYKQKTGFDLGKNIPEGMYVNRSWDVRGQSYPDYIGLPDYFRDAMNTQVYSNFTRAREGKEGYIPDLRYAMQSYFPLMLKKIHIDEMTRFGGPLHTVMYGKTAPVSKRFGGSSLDNAFDRRGAIADTPEGRRLVDILGQVPTKRDRASDSEYTYLKIPIDKARMLGIKPPERGAGAGGYVYYALEKRPQIGDTKLFLRDANAQWGEPSFTFEYKGSDGKMESINLRESAVTWGEPGFRKELAPQERVGSKGTFEVENPHTGKMETFSGRVTNAVQSQTVPLRFLRKHMDSEPEQVPAGGGPAVKIGGRGGNILNYVRMNQGGLLENARFNRQPQRYDNAKAWVEDLKGMGVSGPAARILQNNWVKRGYNFLDGLKNYIYHTKLGMLDPRPAINNWGGGMVMLSAAVGPRFAFDGSGKAFRYHKDPELKKLIEDARVTELRNIFEDSALTRRGMYANAANRLSFMGFKYTEDHLRASSFFAGYDRFREWADPVQSQFFEENNLKPQDKLFITDAGIWHNKKKLEGNVAEKAVQTTMAYKRIGGREITVEKMREELRDVAIQRGRAIVAKTQFIYEMMLMPKAFRNPVGKLVFQLNQFPIRATWQLWESRPAIPNMSKGGQTADMDKFIRWLTSSLVIAGAGQAVDRDLASMSGLPISRLPLLENSTYLQLSDSLPAQMARKVPFPTPVPFQFGWPPLVRGLSALAQFGKGALGLDPMNPVPEDPQAEDYLWRLLQSYRNINLRDRRTLEPGFFQIWDFLEGEKLDPNAPWWKSERAIRYDPTSSYAYQISPWQFMSQIAPGAPEGIYDVFERGRKSRLREEQRDIASARAKSALVAAKTIEETGRERPGFLQIPASFRERQAAAIQKEAEIDISPKQVETAYALSQLPGELRYLKYARRTARASGFVEWYNAESPSKKRAASYFNELFGKDYKAWKKFYAHIFPYQPEVAKELQGIRRQIMRGY